MIIENTKITKNNSYLDEDKKNLKLKIDSLQKGSNKKNNKIIENKNILKKIKNCKKISKK